MYKEASPSISKCLGYHVLSLERSKSQARLESPVSTHTQMNRRSVVVVVI